MSYIKTQVACHLGFYNCLKVHPAGIEPASSEPESGILSIELQVPVSIY
ncbi:MAG: hypothetical protein PWQ38_1193 [Proteiniphilum sp.]|nr:hypothetical protein [Proteiniphilum sp.]